MTDKIKKFIQKHNTRPFFFIAIYAWLLAAILIGQNYTPWLAIPCVILSGINFILLFIIFEND